MAEKIRQEHLREIIEGLLSAPRLTRKEAWKITKNIAKKHNLEDLPTNIQILQASTDEEKEILTPIIKTKPVRTSSGVTIITVVPKPAPCPGDCIYCPQGEDSPKSYSGTEPAILRARHNRYDPNAQVRNRIDQYRMMGHSTDKIQIIIIGGTFLALDKAYKRSFIKSIYDALNGSKSKDLEEAKRSNEVADSRCIGMIIETRPDFCKQEHIDEMLEYGTTMVEIGVQSVFPEVIEKINRRHTIQDVIEATRLSKDAGLKVNYHIMTSLPGMTHEMDIEQFKILFKDENFRPDALKIYPTLVLPHTKLYDMWRSGEYEPTSTEETIELLAHAIRHIPPWCRIVRMQRTMSANEIQAGVDKSNLRELVERRAQESGIEIKEIRYREVGRRTPVVKQAMTMKRVEYGASDGKEVFLSVEDEEERILYGFIRLRIPNKSHRNEIDSQTAVIRELHVYGPTVPIGSKESKSVQHKGIGKSLLKEAERIAKDEFKRDKLVITSGVGAREYYYKQGYTVHGPYVSKKL
ncbi:MAG: tRNA uridine(34) 5-carboxymethylaminomethyl modification radical SAM/GNAT enzyme Elp3 [Kosmotogaceae bacterium]|nr:tRNA uridine(34) 5-carboxymethylaminomethyl modification radical SAM/GNAT enzyme Elp3 [Kosmotogaceae bacterium]